MQFQQTISSNVDLTYSQWTDERLGTNAYVTELNASGALADSGNESVASLIAKRFDRFDVVTQRRYFLAQTLPWAPDTSFTSASSRVDLAPYGGQTDPYYSNNFIRVYNDSTVHYSQLTELVVPVKFSIEFFPFEVVPVRLAIESYGNSIELLAFNKSNDPIRINDTLSVPGYEVDKDHTSVEFDVTSYEEGNYSAIYFNFVISGATTQSVVTASYRLFVKMCISYLIVVKY